MQYTLIGMRNSFSWVPMGFRAKLWALIWLLSISQSGFASSGDDNSEVFAVATISDINRLLNTITLYAILEVDVNTGVVVDDKHLICFANYLDYQCVGAGKTVYLYPTKIASFIAEKVNTGTPIEDVCQLVIKEFELGTFIVDAKQEAATAEEIRMKIGAYLVGEFEFHQEPDGEYVPLMEINQAKLFFSGHFDSNRNGVNAVDFLAEFNPIPEEVIHHIESVTILHDGHLDTLSYSPGEEGESLPFERLQFSVNNIAKSGVRVSFGQIRNPFGIWSDYTSHRNFSSTKNNLLVSGYALKKIDLGLQVERKVGPIDITAAIVHGRLGRTYPLPRADNDHKFDGVLHASYGKRSFRMGLSGYFAELGLKRSAIGADVMFEASKFLMSGEIVYQRNQDFAAITGLDDVAETASSVSGYFQVDYAITPKLHAYGMYDLWNFYLDGELVKHPVFRTFHGLRYYLVKNVRWTIAEFGYLDHGGFDNGRVHMSTQVEVTF